MYRVIKEAAVDTIRHHDFKDMNKWLQCWIGCRLIGEDQVEIEKVRFLSGECDFAVDKCIAVVRRNAALRWWSG